MSSEPTDNEDLPVVRMRWVGKHSSEPRLVDIAVTDASEVLWEDEAALPDFSAFRHRHTYAVDLAVDLNPALIEDEQPAPNGTPVLFALDKRLVSTELGFWVMFE